MVSIISHTQKRNHQWLFDPYIDVKNKTGKKVLQIPNCEPDIVKLFSEEGILKIRDEERLARESPEKEPYWPYEENIKTFVIDNNKDPMYCCALVYDMPHRIKSRQSHPGNNKKDIWNILFGGQPAKLVKHYFIQEKTSLSASTFRNSCRALESVDA